VKKPITGKRAGEDGLSKASQAFDEANRAFDVLLNLAYGQAPADHYAASCLVVFLTRAVGNFQCLVADVQRKPKQAPQTNAQIEKILSGRMAPPPLQWDFSRFAHIQDCWPILHYAHREKEQATKALVDKLKLGRALGIQFNGKSFSLLTPANQIVETMRSYIEKCRPHPPRGLRIAGMIQGRKWTPGDQERFTTWEREHASGIPQLSRDDAVLKRWIKAGEALLPILFGDEYQTHPKLAPFTIKADPKKDGQPARWSQRKLVKRALTDSWKSVAAASVGRE
jgi:hypothetical protein